MSLEQGSGEWLQWRRDSQRTGRATMPGAILKPTIVASYFLGGRRDWLIISPAKNNEEFTLPDQDHPFDAEAVRHEWLLDHWLDIEGTGSPEKVIEKHHERYFKVLKAEPGYQRISFDSGLDTGDVEDNHGRLERRVDGQWQRVWISQQDKAYWRPLIVMADVDDDGEDEIVVTVHYRIMAFKARTGERIRNLEYSKYRNYGQLHAVDLNGDGRLDFVQFVSLPAHLEVILNDGKEFKLAWFEDVQFGSITDTDHALLVPCRPVVDVDGDGQFEILYARFNQHGDQKWHTLALDALTGKVKYDFPDFIAKKALAAGPNGQTWLFGTACDGPYAPVNGGARIEAIEHGKPKLIWEDSRMAWCTWQPNPYLDPKMSPFTVSYPLAARADGSLIWCRTQKGEGFYQLLACRFNGGEKKIFASVDLPEFEVIGFREKSGEALIQTRRSQEKQTVKTQKADVALLGSEILQESIAPPVVYREKNESPRIIIPDVLGGVQTLKIDSGKIVPACSRIAALGMPGNRGLAIARSSDGGRFPVVVQSNEKGESCIVMLNSEDDARWSYRLERIHAQSQLTTHAILATQGALAYFQTLPLFNADRDDVLVTATRNNVMSGFTQALRNEDGRLEWCRDKSGEVGVPENNEVTVNVEARGYGGSHVFAGFPKSDGTEDLICEFPDIIYRANGRTGDFELYQRNQLGTFYRYDEKNDVMKEAGLLFGTPIVVPRGFLFGGSERITGFWREIEKGGGFAWYTPPITMGSDKRCPLQAIGDFNGDGRLELIGWEAAHRRLTCRDLWKGTLHWSLELARADAPDYYVSGDVDGDGKDEALICTEDELVAVGEKDGAGVIKWQLRLPAPCTQPALADVDGDGKIEILLPSTDANLYIVGDAE